MKSLKFETTVHLFGCLDLKTKLEMLESLMEIEVAFNMLKAGDDVKDKDPIDAHYEKLNTDIEVLLYSFVDFFFQFFY